MMQKWLVFWNTTNLQFLCSPQPHHQSCLIQMASPPIVFFTASVYRSWLSSCSQVSSSPTIALFISISIWGIHWKCVHVSWHKLYTNLLIAHQFMVWVSLSLTVYGGLPDLPLSYSPTGYSEVFFTKCLLCGFAKVFHCQCFVACCLIHDIGNRGYTI